MFTKSVLALLPLSLLAIAPLLLHQSADPAIGTYSATYAWFLVGVLAVAGASIAGIGVAAGRSGSYMPVVYAHFLALLAVFVFGVAEIFATRTLRTQDAFRTYREWGHRKSLIFGFEATPSHTWEKAGALYSTDRHGFRTHVGSSWEGQPGPRIFALGGSSTFGYGLDDHQTWPHRLEAELLTTHRGPLAVVNAGNSGFNSLQVLLKYHLRVARHEPTHVVFYGGVNDAKPVAMAPDGIMLSEEILHAPSLVDYWSERSRGQNLYARSLVFYAIATRAGLVRADDAVATPDGAPPLSQSVESGTDAVVTANAALLERNLRALVALARTDGVEPVLTTFIDAFDQQSFLARAVDSYNRVIRAVASDEDVACIDLARSFDAMRGKRRYFFPDRYHPNARGAAFIGRRIAAALAGGLDQEPGSSAESRSARGGPTHPAQ